MAVDHSSPISRVSTAGGVPWLLMPVVFLLLAAWFWKDPFPFHSPIDPPQRISAWARDITPVRSPSLAPELRVGAFDYRCSSCHALFPSLAEADRRLVQHEDIVLEHGLNDRCFNCHHPVNRNAFADYRGGEIPYDQPQVLCRKCHGPVYQDWLNGVHGRTNGYWDASAGAMTRRKCIECHDPHAPAFGQLPVAPGPRTLRMGDQSVGAEHHEAARNPLLIYRQQDSGLDVSTTGHGE